MKFPILILAVLCGIAWIAMPAVAADHASDAFFTELAKAKETLAAQAETASTEYQSVSPYEDILRRLDRLEATKIDAAEAEQIAERVVMTHIKAIRIAINTADGGQRSVTKTFNSPTDTQGIQLHPGETLSSYSDPLTGRVIHVGEPTTTVRVDRYADPVPVYQTQAMEFRSQPMPISQPRQVYMRPNVQTYRTGLFGRRQVMRTASSGTCRMVNGVQVCN